MHTAFVATKMPENGVVKEPTEIHKSVQISGEPCVKECHQDLDDFCFMWQCFEDGCE